MAMAALEVLIGANGHWYVYTETDTGQTTVKDFPTIDPALAYLKTVMHGWHPDPPPPPPPPPPHVPVVPQPEVLAMPHALQYGR